MTQDVCGDGECTGAETCETCDEDCGPCFSYVPSNFFWIGDTKTAKGADNQTYNVTLRGIDWVNNQLRAVFEVTAPTGEVERHAVYEKNGYEFFSDSGKIYFFVIEITDDWVRI